MNGIELAKVQARLFRWKRRRKRILREIPVHAEVVMRYLSEDGAKVVPHLIDTDDNPGERLRWCLRRLKKCERRMAEIQAQIDSEAAAGAKVQP